MKTKNLNFNRRSTHYIFLFILERCNYEKKDVIKIEQTYIAKETLYNRKTVAKELKFLQEQGYITYKRALYNNLTTTQITLTEKSIALISRPQETQIKPQNKTISNTAKGEQAEVERMQQTAPKQAAEEHVSEAEETADATLQEQYNKLSRADKMQCKILQDSNFNKFYVKLAVEDYKIPITVIQGIQNNKIVIV